MKIAAIAETAIIILGESRFFNSGTNLIKAVAIVMGKVGYHTTSLSRKQVMDLGKVS